MSLRPSAWTLSFLLALSVVACAASAQPIAIEVQEEVVAEIRPDAFGIQYHGQTYGDARALAKLDRLPLSSVRLWAYPSGFHPEPGRWEWEALDAAIAEVVAAGYAPWVCLFQAEDWYTGTPDDPWWNDPEARAEWQAAAAALAGRYGAVVDRWIVFDEVNILHPDRPYYMAPARSASLYLAAAEAIRAHDPQALIGGPSGFAGWENGYWASRVLEEQRGADHLDFVSSNLFLSWDADDSDAVIMDRTIWYEEAPRQVEAMLDDGRDPLLVLDAYNASALWTRDGTREGPRWTDPRNVNTFGGVYQAAALLHALQGGFDVTLRWETLGGFGILHWYPDFEERPPYYAWRLLAEHGRLRPGSQLLRATTTESPRPDLPHHADQQAAGYTVQPFAVRAADGTSVVLINKYDEARQVMLAALEDASRYHVYRFDADRHAEAMEPAQSVDGPVQRGAAIGLLVPGLSITVVSFEAATEVGTRVTEGPTRRSRLLGNSPNPFRQGTLIAVELASPGPLRLEVFTASGRHVETLATGRRPRGIHSIPFDAGTLAPGVYLYRLCVEGGCTTRPMVRVR